MSKLKTSLNGFDVLGDVFGSGRRAGIGDDAIGSGPVMIIEAENPWGSCGMARRVNIIPGTLSTQALVEGPFSRRARSMLFKVR